MAAHGQLAWGLLLAHTTNQLVGFCSNHNSPAHPTLPFFKNGDSNKPSNEPIHHRHVRRAAAWVLTDLMSRALAEGSTASIL